MILVTGATGILGRVVVLELLKRGKTVRATKRPSSDLDEVRRSLRFYTDKPNFYFDKIEWMNVDFTNILSVEKAVEGVAEIYHCAGKVSFHPKNAQEMFRTNIENTRNLLYACENSTVQKFCHFSSIAVLDSVNDAWEKDEESDYNPKISHSAYAVSKHFSEMEVWRASAEGLKTVILNPGVIIGSGNWSQSSGEVFGAIKNTGYTFTGSTAYADVRDVAEIAIRLMENNCFGERFLVVSENYRYDEFSKIIREGLGMKPQKYVPNTALKIALFVAKTFGWLFPIVQMANKSNIEAVTDTTRFSNKKITERLDFKFIPVEESIRFHLKNYIEDTKV